MFARAIASVAGGGAVLCTATASVCEPAASDKGKESGSKSNAPYFDPDALERGAKAIREIDRSTNAKMVYEQLRQQELTKQAGIQKDEAEMLAAAKQYEQQTESMRQQEQSKRAAEQQKFQAELAQQQHQLEMRKLKEQSEMQRHNNAEYLQQQKQVTLEAEQEKLRIARLVEAERKATTEFETQQQIKLAAEKAMAEGRARALEHRENRDIFMEEISAQAEQWGKQYLLLLQQAFSSLGSGMQLLLTTEYGPRALYGAAGAFAVYYGVRGGIGLSYRQLERWLSTPPLVRETSRYSVWAQARRTFFGHGAGGAAMDAELARADKTFSDIILAPDVKHSVRALAAAVSFTRQHGAPFRHYLLHGPPGTGKTMLAKRLAHTSGLDYAIMSGGDVLPLGANAVQQIHDLFDWARRSAKGMVLFVDEADAFLSRRGEGAKSEAMRSAINAMLYRTGDQSTDFMVIMATNRPEDLDAAVLDRVDEQLEVQLPEEEQREQLLHLYMQRYVEQGHLAGLSAMPWLQRMSRSTAAVVTGAKLVADQINMAGFDKATVLRDAARATKGLSGRELAKLMAAVQAAAYGTKGAHLTRELFDAVLRQKLKQHKMRTELQILH